VLAEQSLSSGDCCALSGLAPTCVNLQSARKRCQVHAHRPCACVRDRNCGCAGALGSWDAGAAGLLIRTAPLLRLLSGEGGWALPGAALPPGAFGGAGVPGPGILNSFQAPPPLAGGQDRGMHALLPMAASTAHSMHAPLFVSEAPPGALSLAGGAGGPGGRPSWALGSGASLGSGLEALLSSLVSGSLGSGSAGSAGTERLDRAEAPPHGARRNGSLGSTVFHGLEPLAGGGAGPGSPGRSGRSGLRRDGSLGGAMLRGLELLPGADGGSGSPTKSGRRGLFRDSSLGSAMLRGLELLAGAQAPSGSPTKSACSGLRRDSSLGSAVLRGLDLLGGGESGPGLGHEAGRSGERGGAAGLLGSAVQWGAGTVSGADPAASAEANAGLVAAGSGLSALACRPRPARALARRRALPAPLRISCTR